MKILGTISLLLMTVRIFPQEVAPLKNISIVPNFGYCWSLSTNLSKGDHSSNQIRPFPLHIVQAGFGVEYKNQKNSLMLSINSSEMSAAFKLYLPDDFVANDNNYRHTGKYYTGNGIRELSISFQRKNRKIRSLVRNKAFPISYSYYYGLGLCHFHESASYLDTFHSNYSKAVQSTNGLILTREFDILGTLITRNSWGCKIEPGVQFYYHRKEALRLSFRLDIAINPMRDVIATSKLTGYPEQRLSTKLYPSYFGFIVSYPIRLLNF